MSDRYVILGLASPRAAWFSSLSSWTTAGSVPGEFVKCLSAEQLRARLASGRRFSVAVVDGAMPHVDRDLVVNIRRAGCAAFVVDDSTRRDWLAVGANAVLPSHLTREQLVEALANYAAPLNRPDARIDLTTDPPARDTEPSGTVVMVCGSGGTGASTVAAALAQGLAGHAEIPGAVVLADLCRHAQQALLHDVGDVVPGIEELAELHRTRRPAPADVRALTFHIEERGYFLLLGLRRPARWAAVRPRALAESLVSLRGAFDVVICDVTADFEGEDVAGSADVEERNALAREAARLADVAFAVGRPGVKGLHSLASLIAEVLDAGVPGPRVVPVLNEVPRRPGARSAAMAPLSATLAAIGVPAIETPVVLPRARVEEAVRDSARLPAPLPGLLADAYSRVRRTQGRREVASLEPLSQIAPGSLGNWSD